MAQLEPVTHGEHKIVLEQSGFAFRTIKKDVKYGSIELWDKNTDGQTTTIILARDSNDRNRLKISMYEALIDLSEFSDLIEDLKNIEIEDGILP